MRTDYVNHLTTVIPDGTHILLITLDYDSNEMKGPPFNVSDEEVHNLYGEDYEINHVLTREMAWDNLFAKRRGLQNGATESVFYLKNTKTVVWELSTIFQWITRP